MVFAGLAQWISWKRAPAALVCGGVALLIWPSGGSVRKTVTLRVGYSTFNPYVSIDETGGPTGLAVEVLERAAGESGVNLQWTPVKDAERELREGRIDVFPILTMTPERDRQFHF